MKFPLLSRNTGLLLFMILWVSFLSRPCEAAKGKDLIITFQVNKKEKVTPSNCMAIWIEKPDGTYVKTLYASDWLAYGGYTLQGVCPDWVEKSDWANNTVELPNAISGATPGFGPQSMTFKWNKKDFPPGSYIYRIEIHLTADYNEIYWGEIEIGGASSEGNTRVMYVPEKHEEIAGLLSDVVVVCE
ncbi:MAG: DUF2271 domain-containing protein [Bacteroidota bacterium]